MYGPIHGAFPPDSASSRTHLGLFQQPVSHGNHREMPKTERIIDILAFLKCAGQATKLAKSARAHTVRSKYIYVCRSDGQRDGPLIETTVIQITGCSIHTTAGQVGAHVRIVNRVGGVGPFVILDGEPVRNGCRILSVPTTGWTAFQGSGPSAFLNLRMFRITMVYAVAVNVVSSAAAVVTINRYRDRPPAFLFITLNSLLIEFWQ